MTAIRLSHLQLLSRAVLWDIVVPGDLQGNGLGRWVIEGLTHTPPVVGANQISVKSIVTASSSNWGFRMRTPSSDGAAPLTQVAALRLGTIPESAADAAVRFPALGRHTAGQSVWSI